MMSLRQAEAWIEHVPGWLGNPKQRELMWREAAGCESHVIEIGTYYGRSALLMGLAIQSEGLSGSRVYCVDTYNQDNINDHRPGLRTLDAFVGRVAELGLEGICIPVPGRSDDRAVIESVPAGACMVYFDGSHDEDDVYGDIVNWGRKVAPGGILLFHDWHNWDYPGVDRAILRAVENGVIYGVHPESDYAWARWLGGRGKGERDE